MRCFLCLAFCCLSAAGLFAQTLNDIDTTHGFGREMFQLYQRYDALRFSGYLQPQFQAASAEGIHSYSGGDFSAHSDNRFTLRRGRLRLDYAQYTTAHQPVVYFVFQFD
ncbi:MAG: porin, partial [Saprospiraceae bacterium]